MTKKVLLELARGTASEAVRLEVESHLEDCAACRVERARWGLLEMLKEQPAPTLSPAAQRRVVARLLETDASAAARDRRAVRSRGTRLVAACGAVAVSAVVLGAAIYTRGRLDQDGARIQTVTEPRQLEAQAPGTVAFGGARVAYREGTKMSVNPARRLLALARGEVDVDVDANAGLPGHFRVSTDRFIVEVIGTRFIVTPTGVRTLRGRVRILDRDEREVAVLLAGASWSAPPEAAPPAPAAPPSAGAAVEAPPAPPAVRLAAPRPPSAAQLLSRGRAAMSQGDVTAARSWIDRARASGPNEAEAAALDLLEADAWLVAKQPDEAIAAYRRVSTRWLGRPEAETAAFAIGQLLAEGDSVLAAETALTEYLAHYPHGRFAREASEQLAQLQGSK
jgi:hypothetical protein